MKGLKIDQYISNFEQLIREADFTIGNPESIQFFLEGLPTNLLEKILAPPHPHTYTDYIQRAIDAVQALKQLQQLMKKKLLAKPELLFDPCFGARRQSNNNSGNRGFPMGPRL